MREELNRKEFHEAIDMTLSGLQADPWLAQCVVNRERTGESVVKKKLSISLVLVIILILITVTALAVVLLSPKEIIESVAVPMAQNSEQGNYTYEELTILIQIMAENDFSFDDCSRVINAFNAGHGYWKGDTILEICHVAFGDEMLWTKEQKYWYGEMMVASGVWEKNAYVLPKDGELQEEQARILATQILNNTYHVNLPSESNESWTVTAALGFLCDEDTETDTPSWFIDFIPNSDDYELHGYTITFDLHGKNAQPDHLVKINKEMDESTEEKYNEMQASFEKEKQVVSEYGEVMYFWPDEVKVEVYGGLYGLPYAIPNREEYAIALEYAKRFITEKYGAYALENLGNYKVGYLFQKLDDEEDVETKTTQLMWDIVFTSDPEFLSDGYRVEFQIITYHETNEEKIVDVIVGFPNL